MELSFVEPSELREAGIVTEASVGRTEYETEGRDFAPRTLPKVASLHELATERGGGDVYEDVEGVRGILLVDKNPKDADEALECLAASGEGLFAWCEPRTARIGSLTEDSSYPSDRCSSA